MLCCYGVRVLWNPFFFSFCHLYLDLSHDFLAHICFHSHFFTAHTSLGCKNCLIGTLFDGKPDKLLSLTLYKTHVAAHVILKVREEDAMNDVLFAPLSNYRERGHIKRNVIVHQSWVREGGRATLTSAKYEGHLENS